MDNEVGPVEPVVPPVLEVFVFPCVEDVFVDFEAIETKKNGPLVFNYGRSTDYVKEKTVNINPV